MPNAIPYHRPNGPPAREPSRSSARRIASNRFCASAAWLKLRKAYLAEHPLCEECDDKGLIEAARHVHHILSRDLRPDLALSWDNLQSLCHSCHSVKTGKGE